MKVLLTILLTISTFMMAQDELPGWGVYVGGIMGSATMEEDAFEMSSVLAIPQLGISKGMSLAGIPLIVGAGLGKRAYGVKIEFFELEMDSEVKMNFLDLWATVPYPVGPLVAQAGVVYGHGLGSGTQSIEGTDTDLEGEFGDITDFGLIFGANYPVTESIGVGAGYYLGLKDNDGMKFNGILFNLGYNF